MTVATYTVPAVRLGAPRVRAAAARGTLAVTWLAVPYARSYRVALRLSDGRRSVLTVPARVRSLRIPGFAPGMSAFVSVSALSAQKLIGRAGLATLRLPLRLPKLRIRVRTGLPLPPPPQTRRRVRVG